MGEQYEPTSEENVVAQALIDADMVIERRAGEALADADDVLDSIHEQGWRVVKKEAERHG